MESPGGGDLCSRGGRGYSSEFVVGVCRLVQSSNPNPISDQNWYFPYPFFRPGLYKAIPVSRPDKYVYKGLNYVTIA